MKATLAEYVVTNNPNGASKMLVNRYNMPRTKSMRQMVQQMKYIIQRYRKQALEDIAEVHPDREFMVVETPAIVEEAVTVSEAKSNCNGDTDCEGCSKMAESKSNCGGGCSGASGNSGCGCGGNTSNASGCGCGGNTSNIVGMNYAADGQGAPKGDTAIDTTTPMSKESNVSKAVTYLSVGVVGVIIAGIIFKKF